MTYVMKEEDFLVKYDIDTKRKTGYLKTETEKFYLGEDGILTIVPIESNQSLLCGVFKFGVLFEIPEEFKERVTKHLLKLNALEHLLIN